MTQAESLFLSFGFLIDLFEFIMKTCAGLEQYFTRYHLLVMMFFLLMLSHPMIVYFETRDQNFSNLIYFN